MPTGSSPPPERRGRAPTGEEIATVPAAAPAVAQPERGTGSSASVPRRLGRYELLFELARGGMGSIHVARLHGAHGFDRLVAIKLLSEASVPGEARARFLAEARVAARIDHPNVVHTFELGEHEGVPFMVMELVQGVSLSQLLKRARERATPLSPAVAAWIVMQAAAGLHAAHELSDDRGQPLRLVHRDVSPQNVLLSFDGEVHVADFGIAKLATAELSTSTGVVKGKLAYMSPEQVQAKPLDRRSDVFSLGVVLHEALTGIRPYDGASPAESVLRVVQEAPSDPRSMRAEVPESIAQVALQCLAKAPEDRFETAGAIADALRRALREQRLAVDATDLSELLAQLFPAERDRLRARIRACERPEPAAAPNDPGAEPATATVHAAALASSPRSAAAKSWWLALAFVGATAGLVYLWSRSGGSQSAQSPIPQISQPPTQSAGPAPTTASAPEVATDVDAARPASVASAPTKPGASRAPRAGVATAPTASAAPRPSASARPATSSHAGRPFESLGP